MSNFSVSKGIICKGWLCGFAMGSGKPLGGGCGCVGVATLMASKLFVLFCGLLVFVRSQVGLLLEGAHMSGAS